MLISRNPFMFTKTLLYQSRFFSKVTMIAYPQGLKHNAMKIEANEGDNLCDVIMNCGMPEMITFGVCGKALLCHSCKINITCKSKEALKEPSVEEQDIFDELGREYKKGKTRMSC